MAPPIPEAIAMVAITIETENKIPINNVRELIKNAKGVEILDYPKDEIYPMPPMTDSRNSVPVTATR